MEKIHGNTHVFVLTYKFLTCKHKNMRVSMYFFPFSAHLYPCLCVMVSAMSIYGITKKKSKSPILHYYPTN